MVYVLWLYLYCYIVYYTTYTAIQKFEISKIFYVFLKKFIMLIKAASVW